VCSSKIHIILISVRFLAFLGFRLSGRTIKLTCTSIYEQLNEWCGNSMQFCLIYRVLTKKSHSGIGMINHMNIFIMVFSCVWLCTPFFNCKEHSLMFSVLCVKCPLIQSKFKWQIFFFFVNLFAVHFRSEMLRIYLVFGWFDVVSLYRKNENKTCFSCDII
jgi:hypothetical protein